MTQITIPIGSNNIQVDISSSIRNQFKSTFFDKSNNTITYFPKVDDVCRYNIKKENGVIKKYKFTKKIAFFCCSRYTDQKPLKNIDKTIVLILESPHKDEYDDSFTPIAPAQGDTGEAIKHKIINIIKKIEQTGNFVLKDNEKYRLIISNPVPYQTSLNFFHEKSLKDEYKNLRNNVWKEIWKMPVIKRYFYCRLNAYNPDLIINACTSNLKEKIDKFLKTKFNQKVIVSTYHPAVNWKINKFGIK